MVKVIQIDIKISFIYFLVGYFKRHGVTLRVFVVCTNKIDVDFCSKSVNFTEHFTF